MAERPGGPVVVGVDGSEPALEAARWGAREAAGRDVSLRLVAVVAWATAHPAGMTAPGQARLRDVAERSARDHLADAADVARAIAPGIPVEREVLVGGNVRKALLSESRRAGLMVLGTRGRGGFSGLWLGSVAHAVASGAECPVVTVGRRPEAEGPIVLGVDGPGETEPAVGFAFEEAARRAAPVVAVHAWIDAVLDPFLTPHVDWPDVREEQEKEIEQRLAPWTTRHPEVAVDVVVVPDGASRELVARSADAALVVVGSRGRGPLRRALLGSVSQAVLQHAECPVAVVRPGDDLADVPER